MNFNAFIEELFRSIGRTVVLITGGANLTADVNWLDVLQTVLIRLIIIAILIGLFWLIYKALAWLATRLARRLKFKNKNLEHITDGLRYFWYFASVIVVASQIGVKLALINSSVRAVFIAGLFYLLWIGSDQLIERSFKHYKLSSSIKQLLKNVGSVIILVLAIAALMRQFGLDLVSVVAGLGIAGLAVGFAAQSTLADFIAGITILVERPFQIGHWVRLNNKEGKVDKIALRTTRIRTRDNVSIIIPNSKVAAAEVTNLSARHLVRFEVNFGIAYEEDVAQTRQVVGEAIKEVDFILKTPAPIISVVVLADSGINMLLRYWLTPNNIDKQPRISENLLETIHRELVAHDIEIPYPHVQLLTNKPEETQQTTR